jgi:hypothetical protein
MQPIVQWLDHKVSSPIGVCGLAWLQLEVQVRFKNLKEIVIDQWSFAI